MEKVCIYRNEAEIARQVSWCKTVTERLQKVADALANIEIIPTIEKLQSLYESDDLKALIDESCNAQNIGGLPRRVKSLVIEDAEKAVTSIKEKAASLIKTEGRRIDWEFYQVNDGKIIIDPSYVQSIERANSIYIDSEPRQAVYDKWLAMEKAIKEFNEAVKNAPKENSIYESIAKVNPEISSVYDANFLMGISTHNHFSLAMLDDDGTPTLKAQNFTYIK